MDYSNDKIVDIHTHIAPERVHTVYQQTTLYNPAQSTFFSAGIHPVLEVTDLPSQLFWLQERIEKPACIAIGESGLDKNSPLPVQQQMNLFRQQMGLSERFQKPIIIHCVARWNELEQLFKEKKAGSPAWIIHGFRKTKLMEKFLHLGAYLSFGQALLFDELLQKAIVAAPFDRIFLETDDADIDILSLYEKLAVLKSLSLAAVTDQLYCNYIEVFHHGKLA
jgi:TatD DNase family protein